MALAKNISSSNNKDMKDGKVQREKENDHTCRCVNGPRSDGLRYRGDDPKSAAGGARWSRCSFSSFYLYLLLSFYSTLFDCFVDINQHVCSLAALTTFLFYSFCSGERPSWETQRVEAEKVRKLIPPRGSDSGGSKRKYHTTWTTTSFPQRPQALNSSQQPPNGELPPIGLIEEKEENSTALWLEQVIITIIMISSPSSSSSSSDWNRRRWSSSVTWTKKMRRRRKTTSRKWSSFEKSLWFSIKIVKWSCDNNTLEIHI